MSITIEYLWKDRKRHLGMPLSFTRYQMSEDRLFLSQGFLNIKDDEVLLYRVRDIDTRRSLFQRLFGVGTITVLSSDRTTPTLVLKNVRNFSFCASISSCVSSLRLSSFGILVPPCSGHGGLAAVSYSAARWLWISYRMMPAATETLKLSTPVP